MPLQLLSVVVFIYLFILMHHYHVFTWLLLTLKDWGVQVRLRARNPEFEAIHVVYGIILTSGGHLMNCSRKKMPWNQD